MLKYLGNIENFDENIIQIEELKTEFKLYIEPAFIDLHYHDTAKLTLQDKAFLIYAIAKGMEKDLVAKKHKELILLTWKRIQAELLEKDVISSLDIATSGAILIAGKEVFEILNVE